jgi:hypothetical protein
MNFFKASVQYGDWEGTSAADDADPISLRKYLEDKNLIRADEFLIATSLWVGENHGGKLGMVNARAFLFAGRTTFDTVKDALDGHAGPIPVRVVDLELKLEEFIGLFKRFDVMLTRKGFDLEGREYTQTN